MRSLLSQKVLCVCFVIIEHFTSGHSLTVLCFVHYFVLTRGCFQQPFALRVDMAYLSLVLPYPTAAKWVNAYICRAMVFQA